jgi:hypothetical protein
VTRPSPQKSVVKSALLLAGLLTAATIVAPQVAQASPEAQVDQQVRPNFGGLITPPLKHRRPERWRGWGRSYSYGRSAGWGGAYNDRPPYRVYDSLTVDCANPALGPRPVNDAIQALRDGGILYIRSRGGVCHETVYIDHPVIIAGEGIPTFGSGGATAPAAFAPGPGEPCVQVAPGVKGVELRDLIFSADQGGRSACVSAWDSDIALVRTKVRYSGDSSAVYISGGRLILRDSDLNGRTFDATLAVDAAQVDISRTRITGEQAAIDIAPGPGDSSIVNTGLMARTMTEPGSIGLNVRGLHSGSGVLSVRNTVICGWRVGVNLDRGAEVDITRSHVCNSQRGVWSEGASLTLLENAIQADDTGVYVSGGRADIERNRIFGVERAGIYVERGTDAVVQNNWIYSDDCRRFGWGNGQYCVGMGRLPGFLRDNSAMWREDRDYWDYDAYDNGYQRDGAPFEIQAPPPPVKDPWWKRRRDGGDHGGHGGDHGDRH